MNTDANLKNILLISYTFPPAVGIGGRRWAKFAKYLSRKGYMVYVITAKPSSDDISEWINDIKHPNISINYLPTNYPSILSKIPTTFFQKLAYRFWMIFFKCYSKGTLFDRAAFWRRPLEKKAFELIEQHNIKNIIVTIPPFKLAHHCITLKRKFSDINLIVDYRDPWTDNMSFHGFKDLKKKRLEYELSLENEVLINADIIITVAEDMTQKLIDRNVTDPLKFITINNGFDPEDIFSFEKKQTDEKINFIYAGSLYSNLDYLIKPLLHKLKELKEKNILFYERLNFSFYGNQDQQLFELINKSGIDIFHLYGQIPLYNVFEKISQSDFCLLFSAPDHAFAFNTKFFEYLAYRKPIVLFSNNGKTSKFINVNKLGYTITPLNFSESFDLFIEKMHTNKIIFNDRFDIDKYAVNEITEEFDKLLV